MIQNSNHNDTCTQTVNKIIHRDVPCYKQFILWSINEIPSTYNFCKKTDLLFSEMSRDKNLIARSFKIIEQYNQHQIKYENCGSKGKHYIQFPTSFWCTKLYNIKIQNCSYLNKLFNNKIFWFLFKLGSYWGKMCTHNPCSFFRELHQYIEQVVLTIILGHAIQWFIPF